MNTSVKTKEQLKYLILQLEIKQGLEWPLLKTEVSTLFESLKPASIVKQLLVDLTKSPEIKHNILNSAIGMGAGYLTKRVLQGSSPGRVMKIIGSIVEMSVSGAVAKNTEGLSEMIFQKVGKWFSKSPEE